MRQKLQYFVGLGASRVQVVTGAEAGVRGEWEVPMEVFQLQPQGQRPSTTAIPRPFYLVFFFMSPAPQNFSHIVNSASARFHHVGPRHPKCS